VLSDVLPFGGDGEYDDVMRSLRGGSSVLTDTVAVHASGKRIDVSVSITPHADELGSVSSLSAIMRDISERRELERLQQEFLAMASHELRTPLVVIQGQAQLMQRRGVYNAQALETIVERSRQLGRLIDDLLVASQMEADRFTVNLHAMDLVAVVQSAARQLAGQGDGVLVRAPHHPVIILADPHRLDQVFVNLLTNAVKYSPAGSEVEVRIREEGDRVRVEVVDHGIGISREAIPHLFDRFYRAPEVVEDTKGTGLGLYITRRIVEAHRGTIAVESEIGQGSTFALTFPAVREGVPADSLAGHRR
jgi:signal transduction histidine kinase